VFIYNLLGQGTVAWSVGIPEAVLLNG